MGRPEALGCRDAPPRGRLGLWVGDRARLTAPRFRSSAPPAPGAPWGRGVPAMAAPPTPSRPGLPLVVLAGWRGGGRGDEAQGWAGRGFCSERRSHRLRTCGRPAHARTRRPRHKLPPAPARHTLTLGHAEDTGAPGGAAAPLFASGGGKLSQRDDHERQHHAGGQQGGDDDGRDGAGPQRACRTGGGSAGPSPPPRPPSPLRRPGLPLTAARVQPLPRSAVLGAGRGGGGRGAGGCGLQGRAGALHGAFSRGQVGRLVPQRGHGLLRALGCKAKDRRWGPGCLQERLPRERWHWGSALL